AAHFELKIQRESLSYGDHRDLGNGGLEVCARDLYFISSRRQLRDTIMSVVPGVGAAAKVRGGVAHRHRGVRNYGALRVSNGSLHRAGWLLRKNSGRPESETEQNDDA